MSINLKAFPLEQLGDGWFELQDPDPHRLYEAYRVICQDPYCPAVTGPGVIAISEHSHIYIADWAV